MQKANYETCSPFAAVLYWRLITTVIDKMVLFAQTVSNRLIRQGKSFERKTACQFKIWFVMCGFICCHAIVWTGCWIFPSQSQPAKKYCGKSTFWIQTMILFDVLVSMCHFLPNFFTALRRKKQLTKEHCSFFFSGGNRFALPAIEAMKAS